MGLTGVVLSFSRVERNGAQVSDVKANPGGGAVLTADNFQPAGVDAHPLGGDYVSLGRSQGTGRYSATGYVDTKNAPKAQPGEWRAYSRDPETGEQAAQIWVKNDGAVLTENENGSHLLDADGAQTMTNSSGTYTLGSDGAQTMTNVSGTYALGSDGSQTLENAAGFIKLLPNGSVDINGYIIGPTGLAVDSSGVGSSTHTHAQGVDSDNNTQQDTEVPTP